MAREKKNKKALPAIAIIVDGKDEKWYINKVKEHYPCASLKHIKVKPELPERKKVEDLLNISKIKLEKGYTFAILIVDFDEILKDSNELNKFKELYNKYVAVKRGELTKREKVVYDWMSKLLLIVNNPCLEFWYILHFYKTSKFYKNFEELDPDLRKITELAQYEKCEKFYNNSPDIYVRLDQKSGLYNARRNASNFDINDCTERGCSEMNYLFDYFDSL